MPMFIEFVVEIDDVFLESLVEHINFYENEYEEPVTIDDVRNAPNLKAWLLSEIEDGGGTVINYFLDDAFWEGLENLSVSEEIGLVFEDE